MNYTVDQTLLDWMLAEYKRRELSEILVVYDYDDILWPLVQTVCERLGIEYERGAAIYKIRENTLLTTAEQDAILEAFTIPSYFEGIKFYPGVENITRITELGAKLEINSNCLNQKIADLKTAQLLAAIPDLKPEQIRMNMIDHSAAYRKPLNPNTLIFHDDSPHNVLLSQASLNSMPEFIPWSCNDGARDLFKQNNKRVEFHQDLQAMNQSTYEIVDFLTKSI